MKVDVHLGLVIEVVQVNKKNVVSGFFINGYRVTDNVIVLIKITETMSCFVSNYLRQDEVYEHGPVTMTMVSKAKIIYLCVEVFGESIYLSKHDCKLITGITNRVIARTDIFLNEGPYLESTTTKKGINDDNE